MSRPDTSVLTAHARIAPAAITLLLEAAPNTLLVVDEAYLPFAGVDSVQSLINRGNLLIIKSLTKSFAVPGLRISDQLPKLAASIKDLGIIRSMTTKEGEHGRATQLLHTGQLPNDAVAYPALGSLFAKELGDAIGDLVERYHDGSAESGRDHRLVVALHPSITRTPDTPTQEQ